MLDLTAIKARLEKIKAGNIEWTDMITEEGELRVCFHDNLGWSDILQFGDMEITAGMDHDRAEFIAHSAVDIDALLLEVERLNKLVEDMQEQNLQLQTEIAGLS